jgi:hypothetical protein
MNSEHNGQINGDPSGRKQGSGLMLVIPLSGRRCSTVVSCYCWHQTWGNIQ